MLLFKDLTEDEVRTIDGMDRMQQHIGEWAAEKQWEVPATLRPETAQFMLSKLALVHEEISEAVSDCRAKEPDLDHFAEELADAVIRIYHICDGLGISLGVNVVEKMRKNWDRPVKHGKTI